MPKLSENVYVQVGAMMLHNDELVRDFAIAVHNELSALNEECSDLHHRLTIITNTAKGVSGDWRGVDYE